MNTNIQARIKKEGNVLIVKMVIIHPMETGLRTDDEVVIIPRNYIKEINCTLNNETVFSANFGASIAKNPFISFKLKEIRKGETLKIIWTDNFNNNNSTTVTTP